MLPEDVKKIAAILKERGQTSRVYAVTTITSQSLVTSVKACTVR
jgi:hypothetical protein